MRVLDARIYYECVAPGHRLEGQGSTTVHEHTWAWCPAMKPAGDHKWARLAEPQTANALIVRRRLGH